MLEATIQNLAVRDLCSPVLISSELKEKIILITTDGATALIATSVSRTYDTHIKVTSALYIRVFWVV